MQLDETARATGSRIDAILAALDQSLGGSFYFPFLIIAAGIFLSVYLRFPQVRFFRHAIDVARGRYSDWRAPGDATQAQSLATALAGSIGTGSIGGVALSVTLGGPAALFWMWVAAFFGMGIRFCEVTLAHAYRERDDDGRYIGGPMYYMEKGVGARWLAILFAVTMVVTALCAGALQSQDMTSTLERGFGVVPLRAALVLAALITVVILGGIRRIAIFAAAVMPIMTVLYVLSAMAVTAANYQNIPSAFALVLGDAFTGTAATGGFLGAGFALALNSGVAWSLILNEAGDGSAPISHAMAKTEEPVSQGIVSILGPFIVTFVISTATFSAVLASGVWNEKFAQDLERGDIEVLVGTYSDADSDDGETLFQHLRRHPPADDPVQRFSGEMEFKRGHLQTTNITLVAHRSIVQRLRARGTDGRAYSGTLEVSDGVIQRSSVSLNGFALIRSVPLVEKAFDQGFLPGGYFVLIVLVLFGFSTAVVWSYCGNRAITYLFGTRAIIPYRIAFIGIFLAAIRADPSMLYPTVGIAAAFATLPNLLALLLLRKEIKARLDDYASRLQS